MKDGDNSIVLDHSQMIREIICPANRDVGDSLHIQSSEVFLEADYSLTRSMRFLEGILQKLVENPGIPQESRTLRHCRLVCANIDHEMKPSCEINRIFEDFVFIWSLS